MRTIPAAMQAILDSGDFTGSQKAQARVTINPDPFPGIYPVGDFSLDRTGKFGQNVFSSLLFRQTPTFAKELPNVKSIKISRSTASTIAGCTIELWNTKPLPPGTGPDTAGSFDLLGYYTYNRGRTSFSQTNWGHDENEWRGVLEPDSLVRTYQGYGTCDYDLYPEDDPAVLPTGVWLVDDVTYTADGLITLECRDAARLLADQISFPPVVPLAFYPQRWDEYHTFQAPPTYGVGDGIADWVHPVFSTTSHGPGQQDGHYGEDALDGTANQGGDQNTYWLSGDGGSPGGFVWYEVTVNDYNVAALRLHSWGGPYKVYLSFFSEGAWQGAKFVPGGVDPVPYAHESTLGRDQALGYAFRANFPNTTKIRVTFTDLFNSGIGYRAGLRNMEVAADVGEEIAGGMEARGGYGDYSEIVKMLLAWGGFYWPQNAPMHQTGDNVDIYSWTTADQFLIPETEERRLIRNASEVRTGERTLDDIRRSVDRIKYGNDTDHWEPLPTDPAQDAPYLAEPEGAVTWEERNYYLVQRIKAIYDNRAVTIQRGVGGRVWGDIEMSGTAGKAELGVDIWDKKPLLDCIQYIADILGFVFFVDEYGAAQWRSPNTFRPGNWVSGANGLGLTRTAAFVTLKDDECILGLRAKLSSRSLRDHVFVANVSGKQGAVSPGRLPASGFRRVGGWTDQNFQTVEECRKMADLITIRQMFTYRQNSVRIPADPRIQIDDQVQIIERTTGEAYMHYVSGIESNWDLESGVWSYDLTTAWLGADPAGEWAFNTDGLAPETIAYLQALGQI